MMEEAAEIRTDVKCHNSPYKPSSDDQTSKLCLPNNVPDPWIAFYSEEDQRHYYYNSETGESTWFHPLYDQLNEQDEDELIVEASEHGWIECFDERYQLPYWFNVYSEDSTWEKPQEVLLEDELQSQQLQQDDTSIDLYPSEKTNQIPVQSDTNKSTQNDNATPHFSPLNELPSPPPHTKSLKIYSSIAYSNGVEAPRLFIKNYKQLNFPLSVTPQLPPPTEGWLYKTISTIGDRSTEWKWMDRWCILDGRVLSYFKSQPSLADESPLDNVQIYGSKIRAYPSQCSLPDSTSSIADGWILAILTPQGDRVVHLATQQSEEKDRWMQAFQQAGATIIKDETANDSLRLLSNLNL